MKVEIVEKAWCVNANKFDEPWFHGDQVYYGTKGSAKSSAVCDNDAGSLVSGKEINFLNIPVIRAKEFDKVRYDGEVISRDEIKDKVRKQDIINLDKTKCYYVQDNRSYVGNAVQWHGIDGGGYVTDLAKAHKYTYEGIIKFGPRSSDIIWESEHVEKAIRQYVDAQGLDFSKAV